MRTLRAGGQLRRGRRADLRPDRGQVP